MGSAHPLVMKRQVVFNMLKTAVVLSSERYEDMALQKAWAIAQANGYGGRFFGIPASRTKFIRGAPVCALTFMSISLT